MQQDFDAEGLPIQIHGVNEVGYDGGNTSISSGRSTPWLQDDADHLVWDDWDVSFRDVYILDGENRLIAIYNVTTHALSDSANYQELEDIFRAAADGL